MKAFLSYSFDDRERYLVSVLSNELRKKGFYVQSSPILFPNIQPADIISEIKNSDFFVGVLSKKGRFSKKVLDEYNYALRTRTPRVLLIEKGIRLPSTLSRKRIVIFDRSNPNIAIRQVLQFRKNISNQTSSDSNDLLKIGLVALGLAAVIALLSNDD